MKWEFYVLVCLSVGWVVLPCQSYGLPPDTRQATNLNQVPDAALAPQLLQDQAEMAKFLAALPADRYWIFEVPRVGKFFIDDIDDGIKNLLRTGKSWLVPDDPLTNTFIRAGTTVIDAGAHIGTYSLIYSRLVGPQGRVYSFEPQKKIFRELFHNLKLNQADNVVPLRFALGAELGVIEMNTAVPGNEAGTEVGSGGDKAEVRTIDSFGFSNVSVMKIDVERYEEQVIRGMKKTVAANHPVLFIEIMGGWIYDTAPDWVRQKIERTIKSLEELGYTVYLISDHDYLATPRPPWQAKWRATFFRWAAGTDPILNPIGWRSLAEGPGAVTVELTDLALNFGFGGPGRFAAAADVGSDSFGMIAKNRITLTKGTWMLGTWSDDGIQVSINGKPVIKNWTLHGPTIDHRTFTLSADQTMDIEVAFFEAEAIASLCTWLIRVN